MTKKVAVIVHGAGTQADDYPREFVEALTKELGYPPDYLAVRYDDVAAGCSWRKSGDKAARAALEDAAERWERMLRLQATLQEYLRTGETPARGDQVALRSLPPDLKPIIEDCIRYLFADPSFQKAVQARLIKPLEQADKEYDETILVSHSLGSVVSFDVLSEHAASYEKPVSTWFTTGSPLRWLVDLNLHQGSLGQINPQTLRFWHNLYDTTDLIARPLAPAFPPYNLYDDFVEISNTFPEAHDDYWETEEVVDIIADTLR